MDHLHNSKLLLLLSGLLSVPVSGGRIGGVVDAVDKGRSWNPIRLSEVAVKDVAPFNQALWRRHGGIRCCGEALSKLLGSDKEAHTHKAAEERVQPGKQPIGRVEGVTRGQRELFDFEAIGCEKRSVVPGTGATSNEQTARFQTRP